MIYKFLFCIGVFLCSASFAQEKLIFAIDIVRHGDRTPIIPAPDMEKIWPYGVGQLTPKGMRQEYDLGTFLRRRYVDEYHLLPKHYDPNTMIVRSSSMPRTLMSAQSLLLGLYPLGTGPILEGSPALPKGFQPIPIYTVPLQEDSLLVPDYDKEKFKQLLTTYILHSPEWMQKDHNLQSNYPMWSTIFGKSIVNLFDLIAISDRLYIERLYQIPLPKGLMNKDAQTIHDTAKWAWLYLANHPKLASVTGKDLAQTILREINLATQQNRPLKYLLFVAHDTTLLAQLRILGQTIMTVPAYAANINYALFDMGSGHYEVRVSYNQKPVWIERCNGEHCELSDFVNLIQEQVNKQY